MSQITTPGDINLWVVLLYDRKAKNYWLQQVNAVDNFPNAEEFTFTAVSTQGPITDIMDGIRAYWKIVMANKEES